MYTQWTETAECIIQCSIRQPADQAARCLQISSVNEEGSSTAIASHERMEIKGELWCGGLYSKCFNSASFNQILHKWMIFLTIFPFLVHSSFRYSRWADRLSTGYGSHGTANERVLEEYSAIICTQEDTIGSMTTPTIAKQWVKNKDKKGMHMEWTVQCNKLVIELLDNRDPPTPRSKWAYWQW